ncbi:unnamed protein product [Vitrella brassicaformis CCMP3155]|uniref:Uncharacterized protein n=1 Tax=Vitrella brassicaformis (strain CCMP3155) TaxID=1169540 RepID=A0A0G4E9E4_VITBC|nr:unnamed protein product [Vitrella brassicaformis CCMP3155]|eukprot:CEL92001.1 unnamed protein product [Vitrella brassicaformis CCMP3155]
MTSRRPDLVEAVRAFVTAEAPQAAAPHLKRLAMLLKSLAAADDGAGYPATREAVKELEGKDGMHRMALRDRLVELLADPTQQMEIHHLAASALTSLVQLGFAFAWRPAEAKQLFASLEQISSEDCHLSTAVFSLLSAAIRFGNRTNGSFGPGGFRKGNTKHYRDVLLTGHPDMIARAKAAMKSTADGLAEAAMRLLGDTIDLALDGEGPADQRCKGINQMVNQLLSNTAWDKIPPVTPFDCEGEARSAEPSLTHCPSIDAVETHMVPHAERLVKAANHPAADTFTKYAAGLLLGTVFYMLDWSYDDMFPDRVPKILDVLYGHVMADGATLKAIASALRPQSIGFGYLDVTVVVSSLLRNSAGRGHYIGEIIDAGFVPVVLKLLRDEEGVGTRVERERLLFRYPSFFTQGSLIRPSVGLLNQLLENDKRVSSYEELPGVMCQLLLDMAVGKVHVKGEPGVTECIADILTLLAKYGEEQKLTTQTTANTVANRIVQLSSFQRLKALLAGDETIALSRDSKEKAIKCVAFVLSKAQGGGVVAFAASTRSTGRSTGRNVELEKRMAKGLFKN